MSNFISTTFPLCSKETVACSWKARGENSGGAVEKDSRRAPCQCRRAALLSGVEVGLGDDNQVKRGTFSQRAPMCAENCGGCATLKHFSVILKICFCSADIKIVHFVF